MIKKIFGNPTLKFWLYFVKEQADYFKETVLKIESDNISAIDVAFHLDELRGNIMLRKDEHYLSPDVEAEKTQVIKNGGLKESRINQIISSFLDTANDYLGEWSEQFEQIRTFRWVSMRTVPIWNEINNTMKDISERFNFDLNVNSSKVFCQYGFIKTYCSSDKITAWNKCKTPTEERWVQVFRHMETEQVPYLEFSQNVSNDE
ncbi:uncharacterized protein LOC131687947 [Topomyia yanbarensis]|uniref:uncharacterized protein LOC131687947 n=1 Tax=Topomyia yanbarensis TaxID=2498891 RepID=UPI00273CBD69|nr:uncharacterized protein LOC131687947 [Topomyia yanbarensis]